MVRHVTSVNTTAQWTEDTLLASVMNHAVITDPATRQPGLDLCHTLSLQSLLDWSKFMSLQICTDRALPTRLSGNIWNSTPWTTQLTCAHSQNLKTDCNHCTLLKRLHSTDQKPQRLQQLQFNEMNQPTTTELHRHQYGTLHSLTAVYTQVTKPVTLTHTFTYITYDKAALFGSRSQSYIANNI